MKYRKKRFQRGRAPPAYAQKPRGWLQGMLQFTLDTLLYFPLSHLLTHF